MEQKLKLIRNSFGTGTCQRMNSFTRDLLIQAVNLKINESVILHDYRHKIKRHNTFSKEATEENIRLYEELLEQLKSLPLCD